MHIVKQITKGEYSLVHYWYFDMFGFKRNGFDVRHEPSRRVIPFHGPVRVSNYKKGMALAGDDTSPFTDEEYEQMLNEQVLVFNYK